MAVVHHKLTQRRSQVLQWMGTVALKKHAALRGDRLRTGRTQVVQFDGDVLVAGFGLNRLHQLEHVHRHGHSAQKRPSGRCFSLRPRCIEYRHTNHDTGVSGGFLQQGKSGRHHHMAGVTGVLHGLQIGGLGADIQTQYRLIPLYWPQKIGHKVLAALHQRVNGKAWVSVGSQGSVRADLLFKCFAICLGDPARESETDQAGGA